MSVAQLTQHHLRALKRDLQSQFEGSSTHTTEAAARGLGYNTHAALLADLGSRGEGRYVRFDEPAFRGRLAELSGAVPPTGLTVPPLDQAGRYVDKLFNDTALDILELWPMSIRFRLHGIATVIRIDLEDEGSGIIRFRRSHAIHTPVQAGPYWPGRDHDDDAAYGLHRAIESLASYYRDAVRAGHTPAPSWLV